MTPSLGDTYEKAEWLTNWSDIDWGKVTHEVKRLRWRIFQARTEGNFRKLRSLQKLMLKSSSNILLSIRDIGKNSGRKTPGVDGITMDNNEDKLKLFIEVRQNGYLGKDPSPTRRIYIKEPTKLRPIGIPTIYDRIIQGMVKNSLEPEWEAVFEKGSYGFRPMRNVDDIVFRIWTSLNRPTSRSWIVDSDIAKCFDSISHDYIINKLGNFPAKNLIFKWLKVGIVVHGIWLDSGEEGTPQGSIISPLLCNISLHGLESEVGVKYTKAGYVDTRGRALFRYADDLVILCHTKEDAEKALNELSLALKSRGLEVSTLKTRIVHISEGFDFLGYTFKLKPKLKVSLSKCFPANYKEALTGDLKIRRELMGVYVSPSKKSLLKVKRRLKEIAFSTKGNMTKIFIIRMNEVIRGYAQARWHWHSSLAFKHLDNYVYHLAWRWALRKHPKKGIKWIKEHYFTNLELANIKSKWVFYAIHNIKNMDSHYETYLFRFYWFKIKNYVFGKMNKLPDNKNDREYFDTLKFKRNSERPFNIFFKLDRELAESQFHRCPICSNYLYDENRLNIHHIIPRSAGGQFTFQNLVIIHEICHQEIHIGNMDYYRKFLWEYRVSHPRKKK